MGLRLFAALVPPDEVIEHLDAFLDVRRAAEPDWRWTRPEQLHVTLAFMASVQQRRVEEYADRLAGSLDGVVPPEVALAGAVTFPNPAEARVLAVGVRAEEGALERLATKSRNAAVASGIEVEGDRFHPHVTIARTRGRKVEMTSWVRLLETYASPGWTAHAVQLVASYLGEGPNGTPRYETLAEIPIGT